MLMMLGLTMVFESQLGVWATVVSFFMTRGRMTREEKFLLEQFGDEYRGSMARTKRVLPAIS
jgi:protein-S-isoprenylcysteine O-methyltransferase Ste14